MSVQGYIILKKALKNNYIKLLLAAVIQTALAAINVYQIANGKYLESVLMGFFILLIWSYNVKKIAFGSLKERVAYSIGGSIGTALGIVISLEIYK